MLKLPLESRQSEDETEALILTALNASHCTILANAAPRSETENSIVFSVPALGLDSLRTVCEPSNLSSNFVRVEGATNEALHFHSSYIVCVVVQGSGVFRSLCEVRQRERHVSEGDVIIIPRGISHVFATEEGGLLECLALEISDERIDYQACFYDDP